MHTGKYCRILADSKVSLMLRLRPTNYKFPPPHINPPKDDPSEIASDFDSNPTADRNLQIKKSHMKGLRMHAVCTVQTFRNSLSGNYSSCCVGQYLTYYIRRSYAVFICKILFEIRMEVTFNLIFRIIYNFMIPSVIVYDRFGFHKEFLQDIVHLHGFYYFPFTG